MVAGETARQGPSPKSFFWVAFAVALLVRFAFIGQWHDLPYSAVPILDAEAYHKWAKAIAGGELLRAQAFYQSPLYPYLLGLLYKLTLPSLWGASLLGILLDSAAVGLLAALAASAFGTFAGAAAGGIGVLYRPMIFYTGPVMKEPLLMCLLALFALAGFRALGSRRGLHAAQAGAALGLAVLARGNVIFCLPVFAWLLWREGGAGAARRAGVFVGAALLAILPATAHNAIVSKDFVPIVYADGFNFYIGHSPYANGANSYPPEISTDPMQEEAHISMLARQARGRDLKPSEISAYWREKAIEAARADPWREVLLLFNKLQAFFNAAERFDNYDVPFIVREFGTLIGWPVLTGFGAVSVLAAFGAPAARQEDSKRRRALQFLWAMAGAYLVSVLPFYVTDRYRLPIVAFFLPLAGYGAARLWEAARRKTFTRTQGFGAAAAALALFLAVRPDPFASDLTAYNWGTLTTILAGQKQDRAALAAFEKGLALDEEKVGAQPYLDAASAAARLGQSAKAQALMARVRALFPRSGPVAYEWGRQLAARGELAQARAAFEQAVSLDPAYALAYYALAVLHEREGERAQGLARAREGLAADPGNPYLRMFIQSHGP